MGPGLFLWSEKGRPSHQVHGEFYLRSRRRAYVAVPIFHLGARCGRIYRPHILSIKPNSYADKEQGFSQFWGLPRLALVELDEDIVLGRFSRNRRPAPSPWGSV